ncbi:MAG TPA: TadE/TadG family type IV pilus assembly protein [Candidatus Binataceae bacterium]|nr:TadE/TadG family type IV pilus assembly protein [Candidatus Binataceae bacterium]
MRSRVRWHCRQASGQALLEFAGIVTTFLLVIFTIIEMGLALYSYNTICEASREAARYAAIHSPTSANPAANATIQQVAINAASGVTLASSNVTVSWPHDPNMPAYNDAQIQITYNYSLSIPFIAPVTLPLTSTSRMLVSQ